MQTLQPAYRTADPVSLVLPGRTRRGRWLVLLSAAWWGAAAASAAEPLVDAIAKLKPSVLAVGFYAETQSPRFVFRGSGFVVGDGNLLVTNAHVIERVADAASEAGLVVHSRADDPAQVKVRRAEVVEIDKAHDLALLRFTGDPLAALTLGKAGAVREGQSVAFIGFPLGGVLGFAPVTHRGVVSSITTVALPSPSARQLDNRSVQRLRDGPFAMLQLDATAYPGNSGGPLFDVETAAVVGVVNMVTLKGTRESALTQPSGISYAVPVEFVLRLLTPTAQR